MSSESAYIFPGQGSQEVGMFKERYETDEVIKEVYDRADQVTQAHPELGTKISDVSFYGPEHRLGQTIWIQPAVFVASSAMNEVLRRKNKLPNKVAGHSVGELAALHSAGVFDFENGLEIVIERGLAMHQAGEEAEGRMAAIMGMSQTAVRKIARAYEVQIANINSPKQIVISGLKRNIESATQHVKELEIRGTKVAELNIPLGAHSQLMQSARQKMSKDILPHFEFKRPSIPFYPNRGKLLTEPEQIRKHLASQLTNGVLWHQNVKEMIHDGARTFTEVGHGTILSKLLRRDFGDIVQIIPADKLIIND